MPDVRSPPGADPSAVRRSEPPAAGVAAPIRGFPKVAMTQGKRRILVNAGTNWLHFATQIAVTFLVAPVLIHRLGDRVYGLWALVESVLVYLTLFDLGIGTAVVRYVARFQEARDSDRLRRLFSTSLAMFSVAGAAIVAITAVVAFGSPRPLGAPPDLAADVRSLLLVLGGSVAAQVTLGVFPAALTGLQAFPLLAGVRVAGAASRGFLTYAAVTHGGGVVGVALVTLGCTVAEHLIFLVLALRRCPDLRFSFRSVDRETFREIRGYSFGAFASMVAGRVSYKTDPIVIGMFLSAQHITYFVLASRLTEYAKGSLRSLSVVVMPNISALHARGDLAELRDLHVWGTRVLAYLGVALQAGLMLLGPAFLTLWVGEELARRSHRTLTILTLPLLPLLSQAVSSRILYGTGELRWFSTAKLIEAASNVALSLLLVGPFGIAGVALGTTIPSFVFTAALTLHVCRRLDTPVLWYLRRSFTGPLALAAVPWGIWAALLRSVPVESWATWVTVAAAGTIPYMLCAAALEGLPGAAWRRRGLATPTGGDRPSLGSGPPAPTHAAAARPHPDRPLERRPES